LDGSGPEDGFLPELVIKKGKTVPEYGGGLCQVSTTMFRAAVNAGLKITERQPHSFPVQYYNPQGFDATVYDPRPDLRFINNTPNHLLIEAIVDGNWLIFNFYGTDDGRKVEIKGPYILEKNKDGSMKTVLCQNVYQNGEKIISDTFFSSYKSPDLYPVETGQGQEETKDEKSE
jgi:vancomycin resistance protein YoaR